MAHENTDPKAAADDDSTGKDRLLEIRGLKKSFPGVLALDGVDFCVRRGEIHALMGENGAGKSTLIKVLTGVHARDAGEIRLAGESIEAGAPQEAELLGISTVYQEVQLIPNLSVTENIVLGRQPRRWGAIDWRAAKKRAMAALGRLDIELDVDRTLNSYSVGVQQMVAIARAVDLDAKLLVLDEPTSSLDEHEVDELFTVMRRLRDEGCGIVFVTHFLDQVYEISDRITVLRNGALVGEYKTAELPRVALVEKMLGKELSEVAQHTSATQATPSTGEPYLATQDLERIGSVKDVNLSVHAGEVLGLAGLLGSGRTETARLLFGLDRHSAGELHVGGEQRMHWTPRQAIAAGMAFCPEDRQAEGVIGSLSVRENIMLAMQASRGLAATLPLSEQKQIAEHYIDALNIKTPSAEVAVSTLSGGNQQKVLLARWLAMSPKLIILDEPTRGIDVGAKAEIATLIDSLREKGMAVVLISAELEEVVRACQKVVIMRDRAQVGELEGEAIDQQTIMHKIAESHD